MDAIFRLSGGQRKLSAPLWGWPISCDLLLIVSCDDRGPIKCVQSKKEKGKKASLSSFSPMSKYNSWACFGRLFWAAPIKSPESHKRLFFFFSFSLFSFGLFWNIIPVCFSGSFLPGISFRLLLLLLLSFWAYALRLSSISCVRIFTRSPVVCPIVAVVVGKKFVVGPILCICICMCVWVRNNKKSGAGG